MFSILDIFILSFLSNALTGTVGSPIEEDNSASRSNSVGSDNSDNVYSVSQVYAELAELYPSAKATKTSNSSSANFVESQLLKKSLSFNPTNLEGNLSSLKERHSLNKSLSFIPPKMMKTSNDSRTNLLQESFKNSRTLSLKRDMEEKKKILDEKLEKWFSSQKKNAEINDTKLRNVLADWYLKTFPNPNC
ncbi:hypothetical protein GPALN_005776 [Globodera pallida]|nr:hypothetical protein GPALN_005776 [Globodera pallida]